MYHEHPSGKMLNMDLLVKEYLKTHTFQQLEDEHGVCARINAKEDKFSLNYDQIMVKSGDKLAEQCRGLIVRPVELDWFDMMQSFTNKTWKDIVVGDLEVLAWPMNRFYNYGDTSGAEVDWSDPNLRVYEKLDGTCMIVYWDELHNRWHAATRAVPEADLPIRAGHLEIGDDTFSDLFFNALNATMGSNVLEFGPLALFNKNFTYVFELTSPYNRIVVKYDEPRVTLLACRHTESGDEISIESFHRTFPLPKTFPLASHGAIDAYVNAANPAELEGAVVCDSQFRRLKIKNKAWILSSKAKDLVTVSRRSALLAIIKGEIDDVLPLVEKSIADELCDMREKLKMYLKSVDVNFAKFIALGAHDKKTFALAVTASGDWTPVYFKMWQGAATTAGEWVQNMAAAGKLTDSSLDVLLGKIKELP